MYRKLLPAVLAALAGCFSPDLPDCAFRCGPDDGCPGSMTCGGDGFCHHGSSSVCLPSSGTPDSRTGTPDSRTGTPDSRTPVPGADPPAPPPDGEPPPPPTPG